MRSFITASFLVKFGSFTKLIAGYSEKYAILAKIDEISQYVDLEIT